MGMDPPLWEENRATPVVPRTSGRPELAYLGHGYPFHMTFSKKEYDVGIATLTVIAPDLLEVRYHPGTVCTAEHVDRVQAMRVDVMGAHPHVCLTFVPEDIDIPLEAMRQDFGRIGRAENNLLATAIVAQGSMVEMLTKLYYSHFPQKHRVIVTSSEAVARAWLKDRLPELSGSPS